MKVKLLSDINFQDGTSVDKGDEVEVIDPKSSNIYKNSKDCVKRAFDCGHFIIVSVTMPDGKQKEFQCHKSFVK
jgi:hypothetical protein